MPFRAITELLGDRRLVVVSNRAPVDVHRGVERRFVPTVGGMVSALMPVFKAAGRGLWIAWSGESSQKSQERIPLPADDPSFMLRCVQLSERDISGSYYGLSNRGLWPLAHYFVGRCQFRLEQWQSYRRVNEIFARVVELGLYLGVDFRLGDLVAADLREHRAGVRRRRGARRNRER